jgi:hypothetical protein
VPSETFVSSQVLVVCAWEFVKTFGLADMGVCVLICEDSEDSGLAVSVQGVNGERHKDSVIFEAAGKTIVVLRTLSAWRRVNGRVGSSFVNSDSGRHGSLLGCRSEGKNSR